MKIKLLTASLMPAILVAALSSSCNGNLDYDTSDGINTDVTLFEEEISVPLGSIGPITIGSTLNRISSVPGIGTVVDGLLKEGEDGMLQLSAKGNIFRINAYELEKQVADVSAPFTWNAGKQTARIGGMVGALGFLGFRTVNQQFTITACNPFFEIVPMKCTSKISCLNSKYDVTYSATIPGLNNYEIPSFIKNHTVATFKLPAEVSDLASSIVLEDLTFSLPSKPTTQIGKDSDNLSLDLSYEFISGIAVDESLILPIIDGPIHGVDVPLGQFNLKKCRVTVELVNTLPICVAINNLKVLKPVETEGAEAEEDLNIVISPEEIKIDGGSEKNPSTTQLTLEVEALEGTIPDIKGLSATITLSGQPGMSTVALSSKQSLYVKSSSATISGGITIPNQLLKK